MANNLTLIIKDIVSSTLETNISSTSPITSINKCNNKILTNKHIVSIQSILKFEKIDSDIKFIYPAYTASYITNAMMMDSSPAVLEIDDDIADAMKEITAQISGSIVTALNAKNLEELGTVEYTAGETKIDAGENYEECENLILLNITTENDNLELYLQLSDSLHPFVEDFINSETKEYIEKITKEENIQEDSSSDDTEQENSNTNEPIEDNTDENTSPENTEESINLIDDGLKNEDDLRKEKKNKKMKLFIIIIASLLGLVIIVFFVLFFMGTFDKKQIQMDDSNKTKMSKRDMLLSNIKNKQINYKSSMINVKKLNKRLAILTKYEILEEDILAKYQTDEKERLYKLKMTNLEEFALKNKEESLFKNDLINVKKENRFKDDDNISNNALKTSVYKNTKFTLIQINAINYKKYKDIIKNEKMKNTSISICKSKGEKIKVYVGPLYLKIVINNIMKRIDSNHAKLITITKKEFDKRCDI